MHRPQAPTFPSASLPLSPRLCKGSFCWESTVNVAKSEALNLKIFTSHWCWGCRGFGDLPQCVWWLLRRWPPSLLKESYSLPAGKETLILARCVSKRRPLLPAARVHADSWEQVAPETTSSRSYGSVMTLGEETQRRFFPCLGPSQLLRHQAGSSGVGCGTLPSWLSGRCVPTFTALSSLAGSCRAAAAVPF